uniref:Uncharacterized protein n=1 Tax=Lactuca sativa TaxID=4236 RepID=A0A9R1UIC3_LACSA|nr:hypothetical protein LSAT_V11C900486070 [Lactuca sativa]
MEVTMVGSTGVRGGGSGGGGGGYGGGDGGGGEKNGDATGHKMGVSCVTSRIIISSLGCFMLGTFIYVLIVDGSPFRTQVFSTCMIGTLTDFYFNVVALSVWVAYKESSWISAFFVDTITYMFWEHWYMCLHTRAVIEHHTSTACFPCVFQQQ